MGVYVRLFIVIISILLFPKMIFAQVIIGQSVGIASSPNPVGSGARALGMGGAFIAVADDATAASWNPAGLIQLETPEISIVGDYNYRAEDFYSDTNPGANEKFTSEEVNLNYFSFSYPFNALNKNMIISLNYQRLYDFKRSLAYDLDLSNPSLTWTEERIFEQDGNLGALGIAYALELTPRISLGTTVNIWTSELLWDNGWNIDYMSHSAMTFDMVTNIGDIHITEKYSNMSGINFNLGAMWNVNKYLTVGGVFKSPFTAKFDHQYIRESVEKDGDGNITDTTRLSDSDEIELEMPMSYGIGVAWRFSDKFTMDLDVYRTHWSDYILVDSQGNRMSPILALPEDESDVADTTQVRLGGEYLFINPDRNIVIPLRGGVFYDPEPGQGEAKDFYGFSIGSGIGYKRFIVDVAYQLRWGKDVDTVNLIPTSKADIMQHAFLLSLIYHFK